MTRKNTRKKKPQPFISGAEFEKCMAKAGYGFPTIATFLNVDIRTIFRYIAEDVEISSATGDIMRLIASGKVSPKQIEALRQK